LDRSDAKVQAKLPALEAAVVQAAAAIDGASKAKEVDAEIKAVEALLKKAQDAARAVIFVPGSAIRPGITPSPSQPPSLPGRFTFRYRAERNNNRK
jgi:hypothetical protein